MYPGDVENMRVRRENAVKMAGKLGVKDNSAIANRYDDFVYVKHTHCEIHPSMMIGAVVANIPFCNHNQAPRNIFQYSQARQAMGIYASNHRDRLDISYILYNTQRPLVTTRLTKYIGTDRLPAGENVVVAIACYSGLLISSCHEINSWQVCV
jgi:DNA-directed RNA polymerase beta subunit